MGYGDFERYRSAMKDVSGMQFPGVLEEASLILRPLPDLSSSHGEKSGEGLVPILRHGPEMVDSVST